QGGYDGVLLAISTYSALEQSLQLLRSLRAQGKVADSRRCHRSSRASSLAGDPRRTTQCRRNLRRPFSPPDEWDNTGLFTVAPRPKSVPSKTHGQRALRHTLA
ncbi:unnamed protein product, partial [Sphacelaria rigidula]